MEKREYIHPIQKSGAHSVPDSFFVNQAVNRIKANPPVIRLAKKLGVDLSKSSVQGEMDTLLNKMLKIILLL